MTHHQPPHQIVELRVSGSVLLSILSGQPALLIPIGPIMQRKEAILANPQLTLTDIQDCALGPVTSALDRAGQPLPLAGPVRFSGSDDTILTVTDNGDGSAVIHAVKPGNAQVSATDGTATGTIDVTVTNSAEAGINIPLATPVDRPS